MVQSPLGESDESLFPGVQNGLKCLIGRRCFHGLTIPIEAVRDRRDNGQTLFARN